MDSLNNKSCFHHNYVLTLHNTTDTITLQTFWLCKDQRFRLNTYFIIVFNMTPFIIKLPIINFEQFGVVVIVRSGENIGWWNNCWVNFLKKVSGFAKLAICLTGLRTARRRNSADLIQSDVRYNFLDSLTYMAALLFWRQITQGVIHECDLRVTCDIWPAISEGRQMVMMDYILVTGLMTSVRTTLSMCFCYLCTCIVNVCMYIFI